MLTLLDLPLLLVGGELPFEPPVGTGVRYGAYRLPSMGLVAPLPLAYDDSVQVQISDTGSGTLTLPLDDPALPLLKTSDVVLCWVDDEILADGQGGFVIEQIDEHTLDEQGGAAEYAHLSGRGLGMMMEWALIRPANGLGSYPIEDVRLFSWPSPQFDDTDWDDAVLTGNPGVPDDFPDTIGGPWIWGPSGTPDFAPGGSVYLRHTFTVASETDALIYASADNWGNLKIDGQDTMRMGGENPNVGAAGTYRHTFTQSIRLSAGEHTIACSAFNKGSPLSTDPGANHGGVRVLICPYNSDGTVNTTVIEETSADWKALEVPPNDRPGMTFTEAVLIALTESQAIGKLTYIVPDFDEDSDSYGAPIDEDQVGDLSTKTGNDIGTFLSELSVAYADWRVAVIDNALTLQMCHLGTMAVVGGAAVPIEPAPVNDPNTGNLLLLDRKRT